MQLITKISLFCLVVTTCLGQATKYQVDLKNIEQDRVKVQVFLPKQSASSIVFAFPKQVPGTYANYDFGRYIQGFKAIAKDGQNLPVKQKNIIIERLLFCFRLTRNTNAV